MNTKDAGRCSQLGAWEGKEVGFDEVLTCARGIGCSGCSLFFLCLQLAENVYFSSSSF